MQLFLRINLSSYFQASYFSGILRISGIANFQHGIFLNFSDIFLMFLEECGVIFLFWNKKKRDGGKSILMNFSKRLGKNPSRFLLFINLKKFRGHVG